jgi:hypothetical protein
LVALGGVANGPSSPETLTVLVTLPANRGRKRMAFVPVDPKLGECPGERTSLVEDLNPTWDHFAHLAMTG